jgi:hypothetical protein
LKGVETKVVIDDRLPYKPRQDLDGGWYVPGGLINTKKSSNGAYWVPLIEKAAAKYYTNYERMEGGNMAESLYMLTGMPTKSFSNSKYNNDDLWQLIKDMDEQDWVMTTSNHVKNHGLPSGHAYSLLGAKKLANGTKLLKIRNPWGSEVYTGPWSDGSSQMTEAVASELGHTKGDDGVFWMDMTSFKTDFSGIQIAMYEDWKTDQKNVEWDRSSSDWSGMSWTITNDVAQDVAVQLDMYNSRMFPRGCSDSDMPEYNFFHLTSGGSRVSDHWGRTYAYSSGLGQGNLYFKDLPAGTYTFEAFNAGYTPDNSGVAHLSMKTFGKTSKLSMSQ